MSRKAIEAVNAAELRADEIRNAARAKAKQMTDEAEKKGASMLEHTENSSEKLYREKTEGVKTQVAEIIENQTASAKEDAEKLAAVADRRMAEAKRLIIRRIEDKCQ